MYSDRINARSNTDVSQSHTLLIVRTSCLELPLKIAIHLHKRTHILIYSRAAYSSALT